MIGVREYILQQELNTKKMKSSWPSLHQTWDKRPLDRESDKSWCHRHTMSMIKLFWSQPMYPWTKQQHTSMLPPPMSTEPWTATKTALH